jgi:hypothetical protein
LKRIAVTCPKPVLNLPKDVRGQCGSCLLIRDRARLSAHDRSQYRKERRQNPGNICIFEGERIKIEGHA